MNYDAQDGKPVNGDKPVVLVTGGSGVIGRATVKSLVAEGYFVFCHCYQQLQSTKEWLIKQKISEDSVYLLTANLLMDEEIVNMINTMMALTERVDGLVNNAGNGMGRHSVLETNSQLLADTMQLNFLSAAKCIELIAPVMVKQQKGCIVNIASDVVRTGGYRLAHYAAAKAALEQYGTSIAKELAHNGVRVNTLNPGIISATEKTAASDRVPMGRMGKPSEVAAVVAWLLSEKASYVVGSSLTINGAR